MHKVHNNGLSGFSRTRRRILGCLLFGLVAVFASVWGFSGSSKASSPAADGHASSAKPMSITLISENTIPTPVNAPELAVPEAEGFWKGQGLTVKQVLVNQDLVQALVAGRGQVGTTGTSEVFSAIASGTPSALPSFYNIHTGRILSMVVLDSSPIHTAKQLVGKPIGSVSLAASVLPTAQAYVAAGGGNPADTHFIAIGPGAPAAEALKSGEVAAYVGTDSQIGLMRDQGLKLRYVTVPKSAPVSQSGFQASYFALPQVIKTDRQALIALGRGVAEAYVFSRANPTCAMTDLWKVFPQSKPTGVSRKVALQQGLQILDTRLKNSGPVNGQWGAIAPGQIQAAEGVLREAGIVKKTIPTSAVWNGSMIAQINDFNARAIRKAARAKKCS